MNDGSLVFFLFLIFSGAAVLSTLALMTRQSMLVAYILLGVILGPWGLKWVGNPEVVQKIGDVGIVFLLFLLGLHLPPQKLIHMLKKVVWVGVISSLVFLLVGYGISLAFGYTQAEALVIGAAMMFSSTIIGIKLLPTTILHHQHTGEVMIGVLLFQDIIAIIVLLLLHSFSVGSLNVVDLSALVIGMPFIIAVAFFFERFVLIKLLARFDRIREYLFLVAIAWCLSLSELANALHLSGEIGAFVAGVTLASSPISLYIAESLRPVRDFFLVLFFFSVGAGFDLTYLPQVILPALLLAATLLVLKPVIYRVLLRQVSETNQVSWEVGFRLGQVSEFSLIIAYVAHADGHLIGSQAAYLIQATTILTFIVSCYYIVMRYPTPVAVSDRLRRD